MFILAADLLHEDDSGIVLVPQHILQSSLFTPKAWAAQEDVKTNKKYTAACIPFTIHLLKAYSRNKPVYTMCSKCYAYEEHTTFCVPFNAVSIKLFFLCHLLPSTFYDF